MAGAYTYRLTDIHLNDRTVIKPGGLTVFIGPNNSGKTRALKDIAEATAFRRKQRGIVVSEVDWTLPKSIQELRESYDVDRHLDENGSWIFETLQPDLSEPYRSQDGGKWPIDHEQWYDRAKADSRKRVFADSYGAAMVAYLSTEQRLKLVKESPSPSSENDAANLLQMLYSAGKGAEKEIRAIIDRAFGREVALDFSVLQRLRLRVGNDLSKIPEDPRDARPVMAQLDKLDDQGDGIRSFAGIVVAMLSLKRSLFLIDEPEAFLHPPQAFRIGEFIAEQVGADRQILVATHSVDVLRGILRRTQDATILRIDRTQNANSFKILHPESLRTLVNDPLLSSARVLDGLFYPGAIVVEGDSDARFYHGVSKKRRADADLHFVNADNKQTVPKIAKLYCDMGVRCAGLVDFDVLNDQSEFTKQLESIGIDQQAEVDPRIKTRG